MENKTKKEVKKKTTSQTQSKPKPITSSKAKTTTQSKQSGATLSKRKIDINDVVDVQSCYYGKLTYLPHNGSFPVIWESYGEIQKMTIGELLTMRNSQTAFFSKNWIIVSGENADEVMDFLRAKPFYNEFYTLEEIDNILFKHPEQIKEVYKKMTDTIKQTFSMRAKELVDNGQLNDFNTVKILEDCFDYKFR